MNFMHDMAASIWVPGWVATYSSSVLSDAYRVKGKVVQGGVRISQTRNSRWSTVCIRTEAYCSKPRPSRNSNDMEWPQFTIGRRDLDNGLLRGMCMLRYTELAPL